jgi:hypothetical protein
MQTAVNNVPESFECGGGFCAAFINIEGMVINKTMEYMKKVPNCGSCDYCIEFPENSF